MLDQTSVSSPQPAPAAAATGSPRRPRRRVSVRTTLVLTHRWLALILGIALLTVVISGVVLLYGQEIDRLVHPKLHHSTKSADPITHAEALAVVRREAPSFNTVRRRRQPRRLPHLRLRVHEAGLCRSRSRPPEWHRRHH